MNNSRLKHIKNWPELGHEAKWSVSTLARQCGVSVRTLERFFRNEMGNSPKAWLLERRRLLAGKLLQNGSSVKETAGLLNYKHQNHLTNEFTKHLGFCPTNQTATSRSTNP